MIYSAIEHGFDETEILGEQWKYIMKKFSIPTTPKKTRTAFVWKSQSNDIEIKTTNNPITGESITDDSEEMKNIDFAGIIGIEGKTKIVESVANLIRNTSIHTKQEYRGINPWKYVI